MPSRRPQFVNNEFYHIFNRGVEKRTIFHQISDYFRFIFCLYELNDKNLVKMRDRIRERRARRERKNTGRTRVIQRKRESLVEIIAFCLMPNHYHLVLRQLVNRGISLFMKKLGDSYVGYFNEKYDRKGMGSLFQGRFQAVYIRNEDQFRYLICYIFTNPVELLERNWKEAGLKDPQKALKFLEEYRWSSYLDCIGKENFPSVTKREFLMEIFGSPANVKENVKDWLLDRTELKKSLAAIEDLLLD